MMFEVFLSVRNFILSSPRFAEKIKFPAVCIFEDNFANLNPVTISAIKKCSSGIAEDFGYVIAHKIALLLVYQICKANIFPGDLFFLVKITTLHRNPGIPKTVDVHVVHI